MLNRALAGMKAIDLSLLQLIILIPATWRLSYMLVSEDGLFDMFDHLRRVANRTPLDGLFACIYCMSVWVSAVHLALVLLTPPDLLPVVWLYLYWLAISGGVSLAHRATTHD
jgi:hypothetical protein